MLQYGGEEPPLSARLVLCAAGHVVGDVTKDTIEVEKFSLRASRASLPACQSSVTRRNCKIQHEELVIIRLLPTLLWSCEHRPSKEECDIHMDMELLTATPLWGAASRCSHPRTCWRPGMCRTGYELDMDQVVMTLIKQLADKFQMVWFSVLDQRHHQIILQQTVLQPLRGLPCALNLCEAGGLLLKHFSAHTGLIGSFRSLRPGRIPQSRPRRGRLLLESGQTAE